ncbi:MAG: YlbF family regulator [Clostridia bacterium]
MDVVFQKTRELGEALMQSAAYQQMRAAETKALRNEQASLIMGKYLGCKRQVQDMLIDENPDTVVLKKLSDDMDGYQAQLQTIDDITQLTEARQGFSTLIEEVNKVLKYMIAGGMTDDDECEGDCETCGGACHTLN